MSALTTTTGPLLRSLYLKELHMLKLGGIDLLQNTFKAEVWTVMILKGGALDEDLSKPGVVFPTDANGDPTFRPSAMWYADRLYFNNAIQCKQLECLVIRVGQDLSLNCRWEGVFFEEFELQQFPFDRQALTISLSINSRTRGMLPVEFVLDECCAGIDMSGFTMRSMYDLDQTLYLRTSEV